MAGKDKCQDCHKGKSTWDGCAHVKCPKRKRITAQAIGTNEYTSGLGVIAGSSSGTCIRRKPKFNKE